MSLRMPIRSPISRFPFHIRETVGFPSALRACLKEFAFPLLLHCQQDYPKSNIASSVQRTGLLGLCSIIAFQQISTYFTTTVLVWFHLKRNLKFYLIDFLHTWEYGCSCVSSNSFALWTFCHTLCTWMVSLLCGSSHVSSKYLHARSSCHTWCTWMTSLLCEYYHVSSSDVKVRSSCHTLSTLMASLLCESSHVPSSDLPVRSSCHTLST